MNNLQRMHEALKDNPELQKKIFDEATRLAENKEADETEALRRAVRENLDIELSRADLDTLVRAVRELDPEQLAQASGGELTTPEFLGASMAAGEAAGLAVGTIVCPGLGTVFGSLIGPMIGAAVGGFYIAFTTDKKIETGF